MPQEANNHLVEGTQMSIVQRIGEVRRRIDLAVEKRPVTIESGPVTLVAVTKNQPVDRIREALAAGITAIGENRIQEAVTKLALKDLGVEWHLIGHLQTNKVKLAVQHFDLIHSIDSERLLEAVQGAAERTGKVQEILLQVNVADEESKFGLEPEAVLAIADLAAAMPNIRLRGLMTVAPYFADAEQTRPIFKEMYSLFQALRHHWPQDIAWLSMGMTEDFPVAIEEGANLVRVGTGIFGARNYN